MPKIFVDPKANISVEGWRDVIPDLEIIEGEIRICPALTLLDFEDGNWGVTLNAYVIGSDDVSTIKTFASKQEAETFITEEQKRRATKG
jgi:hypothetical protein